MCETSCDSCQSCDSGCQSCDDCNSCQNCQEACQNSAQLVSRFNGDLKVRGKTYVSRGDDFFTSNEWNAIIEYIVNGYDLQDYFNKTEAFYQYNGEDVRAGSRYGNEYMSANMYNGAIAKMRYLTSQSGTPGAYARSSGDYIYADYFNDLLDYANDEFSIRAGTRCEHSCMYCNRCDNSCEGVDSCTCESCQGDNSCCETEAEEEEK